MLFDSLYQSAQQNELLLIDGGMCQWHMTQERQLTIRIIISTKPGAGTKMLEELKKVHGWMYMLAKCPKGLPSNDWYKKKGFKMIGSEERVNIWVYSETR